MHVVWTLSKSLSPQNVGSKTQSFDIVKVKYDQLQLFCVQFSVGFFVLVWRRGWRGASASRAHEQGTSQADARFLLWHEMLTRNSVVNV